MYKNFCESPLNVTSTYGTSNPDYSVDKLHDNNLQTWFSSDRVITPPGDVVTVTFDFGSAVYVDTLIVVHNIGTVGTMYINAGNTNPPTTSTFGMPIIGSTGTSMCYENSPVSYRYFKLFANGTKLSETTKIKEMFIGKRDTFSINPEYPFNKGLDTVTIVNESDKGQKSTYNRYTKQNWLFNYSAIDNSLNGTFNKIRNYCKGSYKPFWFCEDYENNKTETFFVRFQKNSFKHSEIVDDTHEVSFGIEEEL